jgi:hypothetical protein
MDQLQAQVARIAETPASDNPYSAFAQIEQAAYTLAGKPVPQWERPTIPDLPPPRLTEDWFC